MSVQELVIQRAFYKLVDKDSLEKTRYELNRRPHFLPLDKGFLQATLAHVFKSTYTRLKNRDHVEKIMVGFLEELEQFLLHGHNNRGKKYFKHTLHVYSSGGYTNLVHLETGKIVDLLNIAHFTPALVYNGEILIGIMESAHHGASSYDSIKRLFFDTFLNHKYIKKYLKAGRHFQVGHIAGAGEGSVNEAAYLQLESAVTKKAVELAEAGNSNKLNETLIVLSSIQDANASLLKDLKYGEAFASVKVYKDLTPQFKALKVVVVIAQDSLENTGRFATREKKFLDEIRQAILRLKFSDSFEDSVIKNLIAAVEGKKPVSSRASKTISEFKNSGISWVKTVSNPKTNQAIPRDQNTGRFVAPNLSSLQALINHHLHDVVAANMGDGLRGESFRRRDILNYRTGRFATSTEVKKLTMQKDGQIAAFYTYMKNPYATFSEGGAQQYPRSRDPKLLISGAIREIAARYVKNRFRTVVV